VDREFSDFITSVLDRTNIVSVISRYVHLDRKGNTHWACCPFHHETQPSFSVSEAKQFYHCFGCKKSGNAITFLREMENIEFIDALKILAEQAGLEMPKTQGYAGAHVDKKKREQLYALMQDAARHYHENLSDPRARVFNEYIESRQLPSNMVRRFGLGASLDFNEMLDYLKSKGYSYEQMRDAGIAEKKDERYYDVFGKRLMYPIIDNFGHVVAFGGRTLEKDVHFAKYRNSSQTEIFDKSKVIYGVNLLKKRKTKGPIPYVIMTEGYMDVIALHKAGFDTAVASMGTALTSKQARQIKLYSDLVYISYDGDTAGQKATLRGLDILRESGLIVKVVRLPDGIDPDDLIKRGGREAYQKLLDEAIPLTAYKIEVLKSAYDLNDPDKKAMFAIEATKVVTALDNPIEQEQYLDYISAHTGFSIDALKRQANMIMDKAAPESPRADTRPTVTEIGYDKTLKFFLSSILQAKDYVNFDYDVSDVMPDEFTKRLYNACKANFGSTQNAWVFEMFDDDERQLLDVFFDYRELPGDGRNKFVDVERGYYLEKLASDMAESNKLYKQTRDLSYLKRVGEIQAQINSLRQLKETT